MFKPKDLRYPSTCRQQSYLRYIAYHVTLQIFGYKRNVKEIIRQDRLILSIFAFYMPNDDGFVVYE